MAVCITGVGRSGTSMLANMLHECGLFLGSEEDLLAMVNNREGHWEHAGIVQLNDEILRLLGGSWEEPPPLPDGWEARDDLEPFAERARTLVQPLARREPGAGRIRAPH